MDYSLLVGIHNMALLDGNMVEDEGEGVEPSTSTAHVCLLYIQRKKREKKDYFDIIT